MSVTAPVQSTVKKTVFTERRCGAVTASDGSAMPDEQSTTDGGPSLDRRDAQPVLAVQRRRLVGKKLSIGHCSDRGSSWKLRYSMPSGPVPMTWVTYSPDRAQWKCDVLPGKRTTLPGG